MSVELDNHRTQCNAFCEDDVHATLLLAAIDTPTAIFERYCTAEGYAFVAVRRVVEVDVAAVQAVTERTWDSATGLFSPYDPKADAEPRAVWLLRLRFLHCPPVRTIDRVLTPSLFQRILARLYPWERS